MNKELIEKIENKVNNANILDKDPFVEESCKNIYRALLVVAENENLPINDISTILNDTNKTIDLLEKFDSLNKEKYNGDLSYIFIDINNKQTLLYLIELLKQSINQNVESYNTYSNENNINDNKKKEINIDDINIILNSILTTSNFLNVEKIKDIKFLPSKQGCTIEVSDGNRKLYMGISEYGYVEIVRENSIDGKIIYMPDDDYVSNEKDNSNIKEIYYDFVPYKQIGTIKLDLINKDDFQPSSIELINNNWFNTAICQPQLLDSPDLLNSRFGESRRLFLRYENHTIKITCNLKKFIENLKEICDDIITIDSNSENSIDNKIIYTKKLGIIAYADFLKEYNDYYIFAIHFDGKDSFDAKIAEISNTNETSNLKVSNKDIYTLDQKPWIEYLEIDEETGKRKLKTDTPEDIVKKYNQFVGNVNNNNELNNNSPMSKIKNFFHINSSNNDSFIKKYKIDKNKHEIDEPKKIKLEEKQPIEQLVKTKIENTEDYITIIQKVKWEIPTSLPNGFGSFAISIPYEFIVDGTKYNGIYELNDAEFSTPDHNPKYNFFVTNLTSDGKMEVIIERKSKFNNEIEYIDNKIAELEVEKNKTDKEIVENFDKVCKYSILNKTLEELLLAKKKFINDWNVMLFNTMSEHWVMNSSTYRVHISSIIDAILRRIDDDKSKQQKILLDEITSCLSNKDRNSAIKIVKQIKEIELK